MEMVMEDEVESSWKALFCRRVVLAAQHGHNVHEQLIGLLAAVHNDDVQDRRRHQGPRAEATQRALEGASMELGLAVASMGAARHLALRGGAPCPSVPLDSTDDLVDLGGQCALETLGEAAVLATLVHDGVERARGHLSAAEALVVLDEASGGDGAANTVPWNQSPCLCEQFSDAYELAQASLKAMDLASKTADAREAAFSGVW